MLGSVLGGIAGLLTGGTAMAAAVGAGLGRLASGGDLEDALKPILHPCIHTDTGNCSTKHRSRPSIIYACIHQFVHACMDTILGPK